MHNFCQSRQPIGGWAESCTTTPLVLVFWTCLLDNKDISANPHVRNWPKSTAISLWISLDFLGIWVDLLHVDLHLSLHFARSGSRNDFWDVFRMILHGFVSRNQKHILKHTRFKFSYKKNGSGQKKLQTKITNTLYLLCCASSLPYVS